MMESLQMTFRSFGGHHSSAPAGTMVGGYQRRTQKGVGRKGKTVQRCTGKNPGNRLAPGAAVTLNMERFFFIACLMNAFL